jgi:hypothetical protein
VHLSNAREFLISSFILQNGFRAVGASGYVRAHRRVPFTSAQRWNNHTLIFELSTGGKGVNRVKYSVKSVKQKRAAATHCFYS